MKKFLFILLLIPGFAALANDVYIYTENPDKGFRMMDLGALWDKYHKESHDQWKIKINEFSDNVNSTVNSVRDTVQDIAPKDLIPAPSPEEQSTETADATAETQSQADIPDYMKGFSQETNVKGDIIESEIKIEAPKTVEKNNVVKGIGFLLEQKAFVVFFGFAFLIFVLNAILSKIFTKNESSDGMKKVNHLKKKKGKGGNYQYSRK